MEPLISVIVPVYKVEPYLCKCVDSILNQTYRNLEVILVDDGSPDGCPGICDEYAQRDERVRVIHKKNEGLAIARNTALKIAAGEYVAFVDSDDWIDDRLYKTVMQYAPFDIALFGLTYVDAQSGNTIVKTVCSVPGNITWNQNADIVETLLRNSLFGYACNKVYRRTVLKDLYYPNVRLREDLLFNLSAYCRTECIRLINCEGYHYLQHAQSLLKKAYSGSVPNIVEVAAQMMVIHPQLPGDRNRRLGNILIKQYLSDAMYKYIFMNRTLSCDDSVKALKRVFANKTLADYLSINLSEGGLFTLLTVCMKVRAATLFYKIMRRKWHE